MHGNIFQFGEHHGEYLVRVINEREARRLVVRGFLNEFIQKIGNEEIEARLSASIEAELERSGS